MTRASYIGITSAFQADEVGSIPTARSNVQLKALMLVKRNNTYVMKTNQKGKW